MSILRVNNIKDLDGTVDILVTDIPQASSFNVLLTDYVFDMYFDGEVREEDGPVAAAFDPARLNIESYSAFWEERRHLPAMPSREEWKEGKLSTGELIQRLWETVEVQAVHIKTLHDMIKSKD